MKFIGLRRFGEIITAEFWAGVSPYGSEQVIRFQRYPLRTRIANLKRNGHDTSEEEEG